MEYSNEKPMPKTALVTERLGIPKADVFWGQVDFGLEVAKAQASNETHETALLSDRLYWDWVRMVWEVRDSVINESIIAKKDGFHIYNDEKNAYFYLEKDNALGFYLFFHEPKKGDIIPSSLFRGTVYRSRNLWYSK